MIGTAQAIRIPMRFLLEDLLFEILFENGKCFWLWTIKSSTSRSWHTLVPKWCFSDINSSRSPLMDDLDMVDTSATDDFCRLVDLSVRPIHIPYLFRCRYQDWTRSHSIARQSDRNAGTRNSHAQMKMLPQKLPLNCYVHNSLPWCVILSPMQFHSMYCDLLPSISRSAF
jgi:hypothetical protein